MESASSLADRERPSKPQVPVLRGGLRSSQSQMANEYSREQSVAERPFRLALDAVILSLIFFDIFFILLLI